MLSYNIVKAYNFINLKTKTSKSNRFMNGIHINY